MEIQAGSGSAQVLGHGQSVAGVVPGTPVAQNVDEAKSLKYTASGAKNLAQKTFHA